MALRAIFLRFAKTKKLLQNYGYSQIYRRWFACRKNNCLMRKCNFHFANSLRMLMISSATRRNIMEVENDWTSTEDKDFYGPLEAILIIIRIIVISCVIAGLLVAYVITKFVKPKDFSDILQRAIEFLGPVFIKFGQWISTRKDLFPEEVCNTFSRLQQNAPPHSWIYTENLLEATYGPSWKNLFKFEKEIPIGSGCCAQVYKAWFDPNVEVVMNDNPRVSRFLEIMEFFKICHLAVCLGRVIGNSDCVDEKKLITEKLQPVAIKVLHPGIKGLLRRDLKIIRGICKCATYIVPDLHWLNLTECVDEFMRRMGNQVDLRMEADNLKKFSQNFSENSDVSFPHAYEKFTHRGVLVESFHEGASIKNYLSHHTTTGLQRRLARIGITMILKMVFKDNFIHCDLHPGNILVEEIQEEKSNCIFPLWKSICPNRYKNGARLIIIDCGLVVSLDDRCRNNLRDVFRSVVLGNGQLAAEYILKHSSSITSDPDGFKSTMGNIVDTHLRNRNNVNVSTVVTELFSAMVRHRVKQDSSFSTVILSMVVIEGLGRSLDPNIDIFAEVFPFVFDTLHGH